MVRRSTSFYVLVMTAGLCLNAPALAQDTRPAGRPAPSPNPAAPGFDHEGSDAKAIAIADSVMEKMGGRKAWDETRFITWKFFGRRLHVWDKHTGDIRVESQNREGQSIVLLANLNTGEGKAFIDGEPVADADELAGMMKNAKSWWINDSYWLVMPYKLKDSGVTLTYVGEGAMADGRAADMLQLVFKDVGDTPNNKYHVWVAKDSGLVEQWAYFREAADAEPGFITPWANWKKYGRIMLSDDRGEMRGNPARHTDVAVYDELPRSIFDSPDPIELPSLGAMQDRPDDNPLERLAALVGSWEGNIAGHNPGDQERALPIRWLTEWAFDRRFLRFEFTSVEAGERGFLEWVGYFTAAEDGRTIETVWMNPGIRRKTDRFFDNQRIFFERGTFDPDGKVLTLESRQQESADEPEKVIRSVFTLIDADHFTVVDMERPTDTGPWVPAFTFTLTRK